MGKRDLKFCLIIAALLLQAPHLSAQWIQAGGGQINCLTMDGSVVYAGIGAVWATVDPQQNGILASYDSGVDWQLIGDGTINTSVFSIAAQGSLIFAASHAGWNPVYPDYSEPTDFWRSTNSGATWVKLPDRSGYIFLSLALHGSELFATTRYTGLLQSTDSGQSWRVLTDSTYEPLVFLGRTIFAGSNGEGLLSSADSGMHWNSVGLPPARVSAIVVSGSALAALDFHSWSPDGPIEYIDLSFDSGKTWRASPPVTSVGGYFASIAFDGHYIFGGCATSQGIEAYSSDSGRTWVDISGDPLFSPNLAFSMLFDGSNVIVGSAQKGLWYLSLGRLAAVHTPTSSSSMRLFPDPTPGPITIRGAAASVEVTNVLGEQVAGTGVRALGSGNAELDLSRLPAGTYFVRIETPGGVVVRKILKE